MKLLASALTTGFVAITALLLSPKASSHEPGTPHEGETPLSTLSLVFPEGTEAPSQEKALHVLEDSAVLMEPEDSDLWVLAAPEGFYTLARVAFQHGAVESMQPQDKARFRPEELEKLNGPRLVLSFDQDISESGLPGLHEQMLRAVAAAQALDLDPPIAMYDRSADRWHPPGWVQRMVKSEAGPSPSSAYMVHTVYDEAEDGEQRFWIHTHGLARICGYELGCVDVSAEHYPRLSTVVETAAFYAADDTEWPLREPTQILFGLELARLPWKEAVAALQPKLVGTQDDFDEEHSLMSILAVRSAESWKCPGEAADALESIIGARSNRETERGALAARETYPTLRRWARKAKVDHVVLVKSRLEMDDGSVEHCWFHVERLRVGTIEGVLLSQPRGQTDWEPGDSMRLDPDELTGWMVQLDSGNFEPDDLEALFVASEGKD